MKETLAKVPEVTLIFWLIKILATTTILIMMALSIYFFKQRPAKSSH